jgi:hypothetical protein
MGRRPRVDRTPEENEAERDKEFAAHAYANFRRAEINPKKFWRRSRGRAASYRVSTRLPEQNCVGAFRTVPSRLQSHPLADLVPVT